MTVRASGSPNSRCPFHPNRHCKAIGVMTSVALFCPSAVPPRSRPIVTLMPPLKKKQRENKLRPFGKEDELESAQLGQGRVDANAVGTGQTDVFSLFNDLIKKSSRSALMCVQVAFYTLGGVLVLSLFTLTPLLNALREHWQSL